jgi:hypothetical protein
MGAKKKGGTGKKKSAEEDVEDITVDQFMKAYSK